MARVSFLSVVVEVYGETQDRKCGSVPNPSSAMRNLILEDKERGFCFSRTLLQSPLVVVSLHCQLFYC